MSLVISFTNDLSEQKLTIYYIIVQEKQLQYISNENKNGQKKL